MRLTDIMSSMNLSAYAEVALVIFLFVFAAIVVRLFLFSSKEELDRAARLPMDEAPPKGER
jgi:cbb3-type cytochrome oxidase subunit 3